MEVDEEEMQTVVNEEEEDGWVESRSGGLSVVCGRLGDGRERERDKRDNNTRRGDNRRWVGIPNTWYVSLNSTKTKY
jgi:hypothetical protein